MSSANQWKLMTMALEPLYTKHWFVCELTGDEKTVTYHYNRKGRLCKTVEDIKRKNEQDES